jgi:D-alanyl-lipoteichoic acid acyltransferase DltB (MBOAT superfamily)
MDFFVCRACFAIVIDGPVRKFSPMDPQIAKCRFNTDINSTIKTILVWLALGIVHISRFVHKLAINARTCVRAYFY